MTCLAGPTRKQVAASPARLASVYRAANLRGATTTNRVDRPPNRRETARAVAAQMTR